MVGQRKSYPGQPTLLYRRSSTQKWIGSLDGTGKIFALDRDPGERSGNRAPPPDALRETVNGPTPQASQDLDDQSRRALEALGYLEPAKE